MARKSEISSSSSSCLHLKMESLTLNAPPWLDLSNPLIENILERLPLSDYICFGAVCPTWRYIQTDHRRRYAPLPPPMISLPWFVSDRPEQDSVLCLSPFEQRTHRLRVSLTPHYLKHQSATSSERIPSCSFSFPNGWLLLDDCQYRYPYFYAFTLWNPVSDAQIQLPGIDGDNSFDCKAAVSAPSGDGASVLLLTTSKWGKMFELYRQGHNPNYWGVPRFPDSEMILDGVPVSVISSIFWMGKFYCMYLSRGLMVIDPHLGDLKGTDGPEADGEPTVQFLEMDQSQLPVLGNRWEDDVEDKMELFLVESKGKLLLVVEFFEFDPTHTTRGLAGFQVFVADFSDETKRWVRVENLGDRVLFIYGNFAASLSAAEVGVRGNCIYCIDPSKEEPMPWTVFDLSNGSLTDAQLPCPPSPSAHLMFVPRIC